MLKLAVPLVLAAMSARAHASDPFANQVLGYAPGANPVPGYTTPAAALGEPTRFTGAGVFPSAVTPFNPPFLSSEVVSIGEGGSITLGFDHPVTNDPANPFGIDLLIFGNAFYADSNFPTGTAAALISGGGGIIEVSSDLNVWTTIPNTVAESHFPTLGYADLSDPYAVAPGTVPTDFTRPVNPAFNPIGLNFAQIAAAYAGSGGGTGIDLSLAGVGEFRYIRISNPIGSGLTVELDGVSDVPSPGAAVVLGVWATLSRRRRVAR